MLRVEDIFGAAVSVVVIVAAGVIERLAPGVNSVRSPSPGEMLGDREGGQIGIRHADGATVGNCPKSGVEPVLVALIQNQIASEAVDVGLNEEVAAGCAHVCRFEDKAGNPVLKPRAQLWTKGGFSFGSMPPTLI